jgi:hypothetical protein
VSGVTALPEHVRRPRVLAKGRLIDAGAADLEHTALNGICLLQAEPARPAAMMLPNRVVAENAMSASNVFLAGVEGQAEGLSDCETRSERARCRALGDISLAG